MALVRVVGLDVSTNAVMDTSLRVRRRHRSWPEALKREIVAASFAPGASVSVVARQYDVNTNQVFAWRSVLLMNQSHHRQPNLCR